MLDEKVAILICNYHKFPKMIKEFYNKKVIFLTGGTGFIGKVILERILNALDNIERVYILIRPKKGLLLEERFKKEILDSPCFDIIRERHGPAFTSFVNEKVRPIAGDVLKEGLAFSPEDHELVTSTTNVIIHCAAAIDFNQRLD